MWQVTTSGYLQVVYFLFFSLCPALIFFKYPFYAWLAHEFDSKCKQNTFLRFEQQRLEMENILHLIFVYLWNISQIQWKKKREDSLLWPCCDSSCSPRCTWRCRSPVWSPVTPRRRPPRCWCSEASADALSSPRLVFPGSPSHACRGKGISYPCSRPRTRTYCPRTPDSWESLLRPTWRVHVTSWVINSYENSGIQGYVYTASATWTRWYEVDVFSVFGIKTFLF